MRFPDPANLAYVECFNPIFRMLSSDEAIEETQQKLFDLQQELYEEGARNFLFIDVPPMEKTPACEFVLPDCSRRDFEEVFD